MSDIKPVKQAPVQGMTGLGGGPTSFLGVASAPTQNGQALFTGGRGSPSSISTATSNTGDVTGTISGGGSLIGSWTSTTGKSHYYNWVCPAGVTKVSVLCIGAGGGGGGSNIVHEEEYQEGEGYWSDDWFYYPGRGGNGGGLVYKNDIPVTPGTTYYVCPGYGGDGGTVDNTNGNSNNTGTHGENGGDSFFSTGVSGGSPTGSYIRAYGGHGGSNSGGPAGALFHPSSWNVHPAARSGDSSGTGFSGATVQSGGLGYNSAQWSSGWGAWCGGGAAGYAGSGGNGAPPGSAASSYDAYDATDGAGGGGSGGCYAGDNDAQNRQTAGGGGVGVHGQGSNGVAGSSEYGSGVSFTAAQEGQGGSGGADSTHTGSNKTWQGHGGLYGGGGGGAGVDDAGQMNTTGGEGGPGAIKIIYSTEDGLRAWPSTNTTNM